MTNNSKYSTEKVLSVNHWNDTLFSFKTTRQDGLRFENGQFVMIGLEVDGRPLARAYSVASPNYDEHLEFLSIKVQDGPLTSRLQHIKVGDELLVSRKPTGTLVIHDLKPAKNLYLFSTGTGLAPYMSLIQDIEVYDRFEKVILVHGVRKVDDLAYKDFIENELPKNEFFGDDVPESEMKGAMKTFESIDWDIATNPVHDAVDRRMLNDGEAAFNVNKSQVEVDAMLKAGIIKDTGKRCQMGMYSKQHWICRINIPVFVPPKN